VALAPSGECLSKELGAVIHANGLRRATQLHQALEHPLDPLGRETRVDLDRQGLANPLVEDIQRPKGPPVIQTIAHEIERRARAHPSRYRQGLADPLRQAPLCSARQIQAQIAVHAVNPLVVPIMTRSRSRSNNFQNPQRRRFPTTALSARKPRWATSLGNRQSFRCRRAQISDLATIKPGRSRPDRLRICLRSLSSLNYFSHRRPKSVAKETSVFVLHVCRH